MSKPIGFSFDLTPEGQKRLAQEHEGAPEDCYVYHWFDLPDGRTIPGIYDLRKNWRGYLGNVDFKGQHVLEVGPASGFLTFKMEQDGADVVAFDVAPGVSPDVMPTPGLDLEEVRQQFARDTKSVRAAWWHFHREFGSKSKAIYGDIYNISKDIGTFDLSVMGAILLHLANPFAALTQVANLTKKTMIVTDLYLARLWSPFGGALMEINPHKGKCGPMAWWRISPKAVANMLHANGFEVKSLTFDKYKNHETGDPNVFRMLKFFTVVAERL
jgi:hypothetical protein